jgi:hypothetical protein
MNLKTALLASVVAFAVQQAVAADPADTTLSLRNGRYWLRMPAEARVGYIVGLIDGIHLQGVSRTGWSQIIDKCKCTTGEIMNGLDEFYKEPAFIRLPIGAAMSLYAERASGATREQVDAMARQYLKDLDDH